MKQAPILAETVATLEDGKKYTIRAEGGLHYIRGNRSPYFAVTFDQRLVGSQRVESCGASTEIIVEHFPHLADFAALHLSDIDGVPTHAEANGYYFLAGAIGGLGQAHHAGNGASPNTPEECTTILGKYLRLDEAALAALIQTATERSGEPKALRAWFATYVETLKPEWKAQADACRAKHGLVIFGDFYESSRSHLA